SPGSCGSWDGNPWLCVRFRWHRVCHAGRSCKGVASGGLGRQRLCVNGPYLLRTLPTSELSLLGSSARSIGRRARIIRACCRSKHSFAVSRLDERAPASSATCARTLADHHSAAGISRRTGSKLDLGACVVGG